MLVSRASVEDKLEVQHETWTLSSGCLRVMQCADAGTEVEVMPATSSSFINSYRIYITVLQDVPPLGVRLADRNHPHFCRIYNLRP